ncbi:hypothetical protein BCF11_2139 [Collimonas sp. PA-H2]|uniref:hypothetical protein n=1 Tax=Collimonas sp. PA-H2 TaxID=1881062 RepID=UPI000BF45EEA|nr:hypothetical protein [Collimonas sp. PA-H2]PFH09737.1 hypothetical protein BCF11_2139 [Collimonas sp. PA-H2]
MSEDKQDFNELVDLAMANPGLSAMRPVVEKELLHYEIFQALDKLVPELVLSKIEDYLVTLVGGLFIQMQTTLFKRG